MEWKTELNENGIQNDTVWIHDLRNNLSVTRTQMCSLQVPTAASWRNGSCNVPAAPFKTMWTPNGSFVKMEVSYDHVEPDRIPEEKKWLFCGERSSVTLYKQKQERNCKTLQLLGENSDVATEIDVPVSKEQNVARRLNSKHKFIFIGCIENTENKMKNFSRRNVEKSLYLLIMMMNDSTTFQEKQIQSRIMERLENELFLTFLLVVSQC